MSNPKNKHKKTITKKSESYIIPPSKTSKGRRPHTDNSIDSHLTYSAKQSNVEVHSRSEKSDGHTPAKKSDSHHTGEADNRANHGEATVNRKIDEAVTKSEEILLKGEEIVIEGQPAPKSNRTKVDLKSQLEQVLGVVQMGTEMVKSSFPKPFEIAEKVVENWKEDGDFSELPIEQPLVQFYLGLGLRKAKKTEKDIETKLENAGVLPVFRQQWQKAQKLFNK